MNLKSSSNVPLARQILAWWPTFIPPQFAPSTDRSLSRVQRDLSVFLPGLRLTVDQVRAQFGHAGCVLPMIRSGLLDYERGPDLKAVAYVVTDAGRAELVAGGLLPEAFAKARP